MRWFRFVILLLVATVVQAGLLDRISLADMNIKPNIHLILLVFFAVYCNTFDAVISSFATGFAADLIGSSMGPGIISFGLFGTLLAHLHRVIAIRKMGYQATAIFFTAFLTGSGVYLLSLLKSETVTQNIWMALLGTSLYSAVVGPFLFLPSAWWMRIKTPRFGKY